MKFNLAVVVLCMMLLPEPIFGNDIKDEDEYLDPNDMLNFDPVNMRMRKAPKKAPERPPDETSKKVPEKDTTQPVQDQPSDQTSETAKAHETMKILMQQYMMTLVSTLENKVGTASHPVELNLRLKLSYHDLNKLRRFGEGHSSNVHDVHEILRRMVMYASDALEPETYVHRLEVWMGLSSPMLLQILAVILSILMLLIMLPRMIITRRFLLQGLFFTLVISVGFTWFEMYQKEVADQEKILMEKMSDHCPKPENLSWWNRVTSYISTSFTFKEDKCREYYQAMLVNPMVKVSPIEALSVAVVKTIVAPLEIMGKGIKSFIVAIFKDLPVQFQLYIMIALAFLVVVTPFLLRGYRLNVFHLLQLEPAANNQRIAPPPPPVQPQLPYPQGQHTEALEYQPRPPPGQPRSQALHSRQDVLPVEGSQTVRAAHSDKHPLQDNASETVLRHRDNGRPIPKAQRDHYRPTSTTQNDGASSHDFDSSATRGGTDKLRVKGGVQDTVVTSSVSDPLAAGDGSVAMGGRGQSLTDLKDEESECDEVCHKLKDVKISPPSNSTSPDEGERLVTTKMEKMKILSDDCYEGGETELTEKSSDERNREKEEKTESVSETLEHPTDSEWTVLTQSDVQ